LNLLYAIYGASVIGMFKFKFNWLSFTVCDQGRNQGRRYRFSTTPEIYLRLVNWSKKKTIFLKKKEFFKKTLTHELV